MQLYPLTKTSYGVLSLLARAAAPAALAVALFGSIPATAAEPVADVTASAVTAPDRWHFDAGFSLPLYRVEAGGIRRGEDGPTNPFYKVGDAKATLGVTIDLYCGKQWCAVGGAAFGMRVLLDHQPDARDPVIGPTLGASYEQWASIKVWGVTTTERNPLNQQEWAVGLLYEIRPEEIIKGLHNVLDTSITRAFVEWAEEM